MSSRRTRALTGREILRLLEQQWEQDPPKILQVSKGLNYSWSPQCPPGQRVLTGSIRINGRPLNPDSSYRVTVNSFLAEGGDQFALLTHGRDRQIGPTDFDATLGYFAGHSPVRPDSEPRLRRLSRESGSALACAPAGP